MRIGIDIDGVLACFDGAFTKAVNELYPGRLLDDFVPKKWSWTEAGVISAEEENRVWEHIKATPNFWLRVRPYPDNVEALAKFLSSHPQITVYYITSRVETAGLSLLAQINNWLETFHLRRSHTSVVHVVHGNNSGGLPNKLAVVDALGVHAHIDDYLPTVESLGSKGWLLDRPWNQERSYSYETAHMKLAMNLEDFLNVMAEQAATEGKS